MTTFAKPPLIELIVELRWGPPSVSFPAGVTPHGINPPVAVTSTDQIDQLMFHFGSIAAEKGYGRFERAALPHAILPPYNVAYRFRRTDPQDKGTLIQLGNGIISANALPPYRKWSEFRPVIELCIATRNEAFRRMGGDPPEFSTGVVRYIDAFRGPLLGGDSVRGFLARLGLKITLPEVFDRVATESSLILPGISFQVPVASGQMQVAFSGGQVEGQEAVLMESMVITNRRISIDPEQAVADLTAAHDVLSTVFTSMTEPLHSLMQPVEES